MVTPGGPPLTVGASRVWGWRNSVIKGLDRRGFGLSRLSLSTSRSRWPLIGAHKNTEILVSLADLHRQASFGSSRTSILQQGGASMDQGRRDFLQDSARLGARSCSASIASGPIGRQKLPERTGLTSGRSGTGALGASSTQRRIGSSLCIRGGTYCPGALVRPVCGRCVGSLVAAVVPVVCPPDLEPPVPLPGGRFFLGGSAVTKLRHPRGHRRRRRWTRSPSPAAPARPG
jgi:hypothetical protein